MYGYTLKRIVSVAALIAVLALAVVAGAIWKLRADALGEAERDVAGLAGMLAEQVQQSAQGITLSLNQIAAALASSSEPDFAAAASSPETLTTLTSVAAQHAAIDLISIDDARGAVLTTSRGAPGDRNGPIYPQFDYLAHNSTRETLVGALRVSDATGALVVDFFRRVETADGAFLGVIRASVTPETLVNTYSPLSTMPGRSYALFSRDGSILTRYPVAFAAAGGRLPTSSAWYAVVEKGGGVYQGRSAFDNRERIIAARPVPFSQLVVTVTILRSQALARWRDQTFVIVGSALLALMIAAFLVKALIVQFSKLAKKEATLIAQSRELELSNARFATALGNMSQGLVVYDREARVVICNERYATMYGLSSHEISPGTHAREVLRLRAQKGTFAGATPESYASNALSRTFTDRRIDHLQDGRAIMVNHAQCPDGGIVVTHEDITEREQAAMRIAFMAMHDELTQLGNRALFRQTLDDLKQTIGARYASIVVMLIDLDDFKPVNDMHGHIAGDHVLRTCAERILAAAPYASIVARLGGDEFALAYGVVAGEGADAVSRAEQVVRRIAEPYKVHDQFVAIGACVGVAEHADASLSIDDMMRRADLALYAAKADGARLVRQFEPQMELVALSRRELANDLALALARDELSLVFQPIVDANTLEIRRLEALLRWRHPRKGPIPPQEFVRLAEETRLIDQLGAWVIGRACRAAAGWPGHVQVAVNVSPLQLLSDGFAATVLAALERTGVASQRLEIEITETALLQDKGGSLANLHRLRAHGVSVALDDFGVGFSSMSYLKQFPFDRLKIDRSFVADITRDAASAAIIAATVQLANAFGIEITAEGVETLEQYEVLRAAGVHAMQGYLFGRPEPIGRDLPSIGLPTAPGRSVA